MNIIYGENTIFMLKIIISMFFVGVLSASENDVIKSTITVKGGEYDCELLVMDKNGKLVAHEMGVEPNEKVKIDLPCEKLTVKIRSGDESAYPDWYYCTTIDVSKRNSSFEFNIPDGCVDLSIDAEKYNKLIDNRIMMKMESCNKEGKVDGISNMVYFLQKEKFFYNGNLYNIKDSFYKISFFNIKSKDPEYIDIIKINTINEKYVIEWSK